MPIPEPLAPDLLLINGRVLTLDARNTVAEALAIKEGKILAVGTTAEIEALAGPRTEAIDLQGRTALPGLVDTHVHLASEAAAAHQVEVRDFYVEIRTLSELLDRLRERAAATPPGEWVVAHGSPMQEFRLAERRRPTRAELDAAVPNHPAFVYFGAHITVANSRALAAAGITRDTPDPPGGAIERDATGEPTGVLKERAQQLVKRLAPGAQALEEGILALLHRCLARGVTSIHDILTSREEVQAYERLAASGRLPVRVHMLLRVIESKFSKESLLDLGLVHGLGNEFLKLGGIKMSVDGGFTGRNAAFYEPLEGEPHNCGLIRIEMGELEETVWRYHEAGMRICTHAMGDRATDMVLEAYEKALRRLPRPDHRHRVEHLGNWLMTPERLARVRALQVIPVPNPSMFYYLGDMALATLGARRLERGFPFRSLLANGSPLVFGSDAPGYWPVDLLRDIGNAVTRITLSGTTIAPEERITVLDALRAATVNAAYVGFEEHRLGTLEPGKLADIAVLARDPLAVAPEELKDIPVDLTLVQGKVVYRR
ncbi:MAG TPA: amidohydrolase [Chloroflexota bacterium]|nr:amidohydrolase [Chloroflexota bacterium]